MNEQILPQSKGVKFLLYKNKKKRDTLFLVKEKSLLPGCAYIHKHHNFPYM